MEINRRQILAGLAGGSSLLALSNLSAFGLEHSKVSFAGLKQFRNGQTALSLLDHKARNIQDIKLPARCHGMACSANQLIVFARRPGWFFIVVDLEHLTIVRKVSAVSGRHFFGHGAFSHDGSKLFATENHFETGEGIIGIYDARRQFQRVGEFKTHGIGPHDIKHATIANNDTLIIANGGIKTHPDAPRTPLNLDTMLSSITYLDPKSGALIDKVEAPQKWHQLSLRHLSVRQDGLVIAGGQYKGPKIHSIPLIAFHKQGDGLRFATMTKALQTSLRQYIGSVAFDETGTLASVSAPRGNKAVIIDAEKQAFLHEETLHDVCGIAPDKGTRFLLSGANQTRFSNTSEQPIKSSQAKFNWDNHLIKLREV